jgi:malate dehydrogenase (oxaloacetate-decarboxylating)
MEGKAALFKRFAGHRRLADLPGHHRRRTRSSPVVKAIAPGFGGINLGGHQRAAVLRGRAPAAGTARHPGFHDDQHGTAIVVLAALTNALRCVQQGAGGREGRHLRRRARPGPRWPSLLLAAGRCGGC